MKISLLHPSRGRPKKSFQTISKWLKNANGCYGRPEVIVSLDDDDFNLKEYIELYGEKRIIVNKNRSAVDAINNAARAATGEFFIVVSDDTDCPEQWDTALIDLLKGKTDFIVKTKDGIQDWIITMPVMDRAYYNRFGYIYHPDYLHMFCDTELSCVADMTGRRINIPITFLHLHHSVGGYQRDDVSERADATWNHGEKTFISRAKNKFGLKESDIKGQVTDRNYKMWANSKGVRI